MTVATIERSPASESNQILHPLEPLTAQEIGLAVQLIRQDKAKEANFRFETVTLHEPPKDLVLSFRPGDPIERQAFLRLLDNSTGSAYEAVVSLTQGRVLSWDHIPGVQPRIMLDEFLECEAAVKSSPEFRAALAKRGITDIDLLMVDPWSTGNYGGIESEPGRRVLRAFCWIRSEPTDNGYAHPVEGLIPLVDLNRMEVIAIEEYDDAPLPPKSINYARRYRQFRQDLKPIEILQPEGPSFRVEGHKVEWQKWSFRIGFNPREGLVLYQVGYADQGRIRPILYRASLAEMVVPYGDPTGNHFRKNAFDLGEYGIGMLANSLQLNCDCLGEIRYFDAHLTDSRGNVQTIAQAVCMHEEDFGILWKHMDWRTNETEVRRSRRLVVSFIATVGNYEYGFFWYFYQDGSVDYEVKLTGILNTAAVKPGVDPKYGALMAPGLVGHIHQHFFSIRLDMHLDGPNNSVYEINTEAVPYGPENPHGNAFFAKPTLLATEQEAQRVINPQSARYWKIVNPGVKNELGKPVSYRLVPGENVLPFFQPESSIAKRAGFTTKHLWVTPYSPAEHSPAGSYPNQSPGGEGLPKWTEANRPIVDTNVVVWYTMGAHHSPRPEDFPVMPCSYIRFHLKPDGFFSENPGMDVPPTEMLGSRPHHCH